MAKFFTKKVCLIILAAVVAVGGIIWAIAANLTPKFDSGIKSIPAANYVSGNGTAAVMVDNYLYFVGDSVTTSTIQYGDNEYFAKGSIHDAGIFRVKIGENSQPVLNYKYDNTYIDENTGDSAEWKEGDDKYNTVVSEVKDWQCIGKQHNGIEAVVPKIAGHEKTAMWVFGKYLIYVSPHNRLNNRGKLMSDYLDFFRVDLDGKNHTLIYTTDSTDLTTKNFTVWADATNNIYLLVSETDNSNENPEPKIKKIDIKTQKVTVLDTKVSNVILPTATQYGKQNESLSQVYGGVMSYVYYTKARDENSTAKGNLLYRCAINNGQPENIGGANSTAERGTTFTPLAVTPMDTDGAHASAQFVYAIEVTANSASLIEKDLYVVTNQNMANYTHQERETNHNDLGLKKDSSVAIYANGFCSIDNKLYHYNVIDTRMILEQSNGESKVLLSATIDSALAVMGDEIYLQSGNIVYVVNRNGISKNISIVDKTTSTDSSESETDEQETKNNTLPIAVLYQPQGNTGDALIFVESASDIRLYHTDQTYQYLRLKAQ